MDFLMSGGRSAWQMAPDADALQPYLNGELMRGGEGLIGKVLQHYGLWKGDYGG